MSGGGDAPPGDGGSSRDDVNDVRESDNSSGGSDVLDGEDRDRRRRVGVDGDDERRGRRRDRYRHDDEYRSRYRDRYRYGDEDRGRYRDRYRGRRRSDGSPRGRRRRDQLDLRDRDRQLGARDRERQLEARDRDRQLESRDRDRRPEARDARTGTLGKRHRLDGGRDRHSGRHDRSHWDSKHRRRSSPRSTRDGGDEHRRRSAGNAPLERGGTAFRGPIIGLHHPSGGVLGPPGSVGGVLGPPGMPLGGPPAPGVLPIVPILGGPPGGAPVGPPGASLLGNPPEGTPRFHPNLMQRDHNRAHRWGRRDRPFRHKRQRRIQHNAPPPLTLVDLVVRLGDVPPTALPANIEGLSRAIEEALSTKQEELIDIIVKCILKLPTKTSIFATLLGLLSLKAHEFVSDAIGRLAKSLEESLQRGDGLAVKMLTRCCGALATIGLVQCKDYVDVLHALLDVGASVSDASLAHGGADELAYAAGMSLFWGGSAVQRAHPEEFDALMEKLSRHADTCSADAESTFRPFVTVEEQDGEEDGEGEPQDNGDESQHGDGGVVGDGRQSKGFFDQMVELLSTASTGDWIVGGVIRPHEAFAERFESCETIAWPLPSIPSEFHDDGVAGPRVMCPLLQIDAASPTDRLLAHDYVEDVLVRFEDDRSLCVRRLLAIPASINSLPLVVEAVLIKMLRIPRPMFNPAYHGSVLIQLCMENSMALSLVRQAVMRLYPLLDTMDVGCASQLAAWFARHLSNFNFEWDWSAWEDALSSPADSPKRLFIREVLEHATRMSYAERIRKTIPETFVSELPPIGAPVNVYLPPKESSAMGKDTPMITSSGDVKEGDNADGEENKDEDDVDDVDDDSDDEDDVSADMTDAHITAFADVYEGILSKEPTDALQARLDAHALDSDDATSILTTAILQAGSKSYSHLLATLQRNHSLMAKTASNSEEVVLRATQRVWKTSQLHFLIAVDKLLAYRVVSPLAVVNFIFSSLQGEFTRMYVWELLRIAIEKALARTAKTKATLMNAEKAAREASILGEEQQDDGSTSLVADCAGAREAHECAEMDQREVFLVIFQRFCMCLSDRISDAESNDESLEEDRWFRTTLGRLSQVGRMYHREIDPLKHTLEDILFTTEVDDRITEVFQKFRQL